MEELLEGEKEANETIPMFARSFSELSKEDQDEIINLIKFKKMYNIIQIWGREINLVLFLYFIHL